MRKILSTISIVSLLALCSSELSAIAEPHSPAPNTQIRSSKSKLRARIQYNVNQSPLGQPQPGLNLNSGATSDFALDCNGVRGGAAGTPLIDLSYKDSGQSFYAAPVGGHIDKWERAVMQAMWQLALAECTLPPPGGIATIGNKVHDGYWSETGQDQGGQWYPIEKDPQWAQNPINPGCSIWMPNGRTHLYCNGAFKAVVTFNRAGEVRAKLVKSAFPQTYTDAMLKSLQALSHHPVVCVPSGSGDSIDLVLDIMVTRPIGPMMTADAKPTKP